MPKKTRKIHGYLLGPDMENAWKGKPPLSLTIWNKPTSDKIKRQEVEITIVLVAKKET